MPPEPAVLCPSCGYSRAPAGPGGERRCPICGHAWTPVPPSKWALRRAWQRRPVRLVAFAIFWLGTAWNIGRGVGSMAGRGWAVATGAGIAALGILAVVVEERDHAAGPASLDQLAEGTQASRRTRRGTTARTTTAATRKGSSR